MIVFTAIGVIAIAILGRFFIPSFSIALLALTLLQYTTNFLSSNGTSAAIAACLCLLFLACALVSDISHIDELKRGKIKYYQ